jgi:hypothetical protein
MDKLRFEEAVRAAKAQKNYSGGNVGGGKVNSVNDNNGNDNGNVENSIGILNEKSVHAVLKRYYEPHDDSHEIKIGGFVADIVNEQGIIEIQTGSFDRLKKKLTAFLAVTNVMVVYPIVIKKRVYNISTGKAYASPKKSTIWDFLSEVGKLRELAAHENLSFTLCLITADEMRKGTGRKSVKLDRIPTGLADEIPLKNASDWHIFTDELPDSFVMKDFERVSRLKGLFAWTALQGLCAAGIVAKTGKRGNAYVYEKTTNSNK